MKKIIVSASFLLFNLMVSSAFSQSKPEEGWVSWTNFKKYVNQNKEVKEKQKGEVRVVYLGDSIFEGWSVARPYFFEGKPFYNRGISGQVTAQMVLRFQEDVVDLHPDVLVLKAGINDIAENAGAYDQQKTLNNIKLIVQLAKANKIKDDKKNILEKVINNDPKKISWTVNLKKSLNISSLIFLNSISISFSVPVASAGSVKPMCNLCLTSPINTGQFSFAPPHTVIT